VNDKVKETQAALDPLDVFVNEVLDQDSKQTDEEIKKAESAPVEDAKKEEPASGDDKKPKEDGFQKRIDKVTADKYTEKRRADDLQIRIDAFEKSEAKKSLVKPKLDDPEINYDEELFAKANLQHDIDQGVQDVLSQQSADAKAEQQKTESEKVLTTFNERVTTLGKSDFDEKANAVPNLPTGVADAIMQSEQGAEMVYHLGSPENAEQANAIANMTPEQAMMELGKLSTKLSAKPEIKLSAAPEPIETLKSSSALSSDIGDDIPIAEWMQKHG
jgi:hypothetical protein